MFCFSYELLLLSMQSWRVWHQKDRSLMLDNLIPKWMSCKKLFISFFFIFRIWINKLSYQLAKTFLEKVKAFGLKRKKTSKRMIVFKLSLILVPSKADKENYLCKENLTKSPPSLFWNKYFILILRYLLVSWQFMTYECLSSQ